MGGELVSSPLTKRVPVLNCSEQFDRAFPVYLAMGMTVEQYWDDDCCLVRAYREAQRIRDLRRNQELWLQGAYIYQSLLSVAPIYHPFAKHPKPGPYPEEPYPLDERDKREQDERKERAKMEKMKRQVSAWANAVNKRIRGDVANA